MAWIRTIEIDDADDELRPLYEETRDPKTGLDNILKIHSLHPASLRGHYDLYKTLMYGRSPLRRRQREMIAVVVSAANECHY